MLLCVAEQSTTKKEKKKICNKITDWMISSTWKRDTNNNNEIFTVKNWENSNEICTDFHLTNERWRLRRFLSMFTVMYKLSFWQRGKLMAHELYEIENCVITREREREIKEACCYRKYFLLYFYRHNDAHLKKLY